MATIGVNERGFRVGESHQRAKFTDREIELMRSLHDAPHHLSYKAIGQRFECGHSYVRRVCLFLVRASHASEFREI